MAPLAVRTCTLLAAAIVAGTGGLAQAAKTVTVPGAADLGSYPALIPIASAPKQTPVLKTSDGKVLYPMVVTSGGKSYLAVLLPAVKKDESTSFTLSLTSAPPKLSEAPLVSLSRGGAAVNVKLGDQRFARYNSSFDPKPYTWPIWGPGQIYITRQFPQMDIEGEDKDHPHHRGFWFSHGNVNGIDFWTEGPKQGKIVQRSQKQATADGVCRLTTTDDWVAPNGKTFCTDERTLLFWGSDHPRVIDFFITIKAPDAPVTFGDTKEGTCAIRVQKWMTVQNKTGHIETSEGVRDLAAWGKRAKWVDYYGPAQKADGSPTGKTVGVAMLEYPDNFRFPTYWHARDYGLFSANPFGIHDFTNDKTKSGAYTIPKGGSLTLKYRLVLHEGDTSQAKIADFASQFYQGMAPVSMTK